MDRVPARLLRRHRRRVGQGGGQARRVVGPLLGIQVGERPRLLGARERLLLLLAPVRPPDLDAGGRLDQSQGRPARAIARGQGVRRDHEPVRLVGAGVAVLDRRVRGGDAE
ncbi:MAG TPA: hypothetical protein VM597_37600 [Gemmataceae bacterium]|nr:hypothetical protein [Gemmataceae bacterium]